MSYTSTTDTNTNATTDPIRQHPCVVWLVYNRKARLPWRTSSPKSSGLYKASKAKQPQFSTHLNVLAVSPKCSTMTYAETMFTCHSEYTNGQRRKMTYKGPNNVV